jgi:hypothetical protein
VEDSTKEVLDIIKITSAGTIIKETLYSEIQTNGITTD